MNPLLLDQDGREAAFEEATRDVFSDTPETDAALVDHMPKYATEWSERERDELRQAISGRTVSCEQCNEAARKIEQMREAIKNAAHFASCILIEAGKQWQATQPLPDAAVIEAVAQQIQDELQPFLQ